MANTVRNEAARLRELYYASFIGHFGMTGRVEGRMQSAQYLTVDPEGNIWTSDFNRNTILKFSRVGEFLDEFGSATDDNISFKYPRGLTFDPDGNLWLADAQNFRLIMLDPALSLIQSISMPELKLASVKINKSGSLVASDTEKQRMFVFSKEGVLEKEVSSVDNIGRFDFIFTHVINSKNEIIAAEFFKHRLIRIDPELKMGEPFAEKFFKDNPESLPLGLAVDQDDFVYMTDVYTGMIHKFSPEGKLIFNLRYPKLVSRESPHPVDLALDSQDVLWILDESNCLMLAFKVKS
ncbi:NHL repeat-containing protein [candidate division KSB1 bacterium]